MTHNPMVVDAFFKSYGIPVPMREFMFHPTRKWRFDYAWRENPIDSRRWVALEVQGGIFVQGRHSRGAAMLKEWEKLNTAASMGWKILYFQPRDLLTKQAADMIKSSLLIL